MTPKPAADKGSPPPRILPDSCLMMTRAAIARPLGTMIAYGFPKGDVAVDLAIANRLGASVLEILPDWRSFPDAKPLRDRIRDEGFSIHSAHGSWGRQAIFADRVDLGSIDSSVWSASVDDLKRCVDWLAAVGGTHLVVHPGGLSDPEQVAARRDALAQGLSALADHAVGLNTMICVENMPSGVFPGSQMVELAQLVAELNRAQIRLCLDTGHANIVASAATETIEAGRWLATTHVHDNNGRSDTHDPPGIGTVVWDEWLEALDQINYRGPVMLECIRHLRSNPDSLNRSLMERLDRMTGSRSSSSSSDSHSEHL
jgi:sugar phosphate isomerase/epimerase